MPALTVIREAAVTLLRDALPDLHKVESLGGQMTLDAAALKNLPPESVFVVIAGARNAGESLDFDLVGNFAAFVLTRGRPKEEQREADALALAETIARTLHGATFGLSGVGPARVVEISPLDNADTDAKGYSVWFVLWQQYFCIC